MKPTQFFIDVNIQGETVIFNACNRAEGQTVQDKSPGNLIKFDQTELCDEVKKNKDVYSSLHQINLKFNGLCELICNFVIMEDKLGRTFKHNKRFSDAFAKKSFEMKADDDKLVLIEKEKISRHRFYVTDLNEDKIRKSHILHVSTLFQKIIAYFFNIYPHDLFRPFESNQKNGLVNESALAEKLDALPDGHYVKFSVFKKTFFDFEGHSMVIKKTKDSYSFFDPNEGEYTELAFTELCEKINEAMRKHQGTHMAFMDGEAYVKSLQQEDTPGKDPAPA
ncbi:hypothetical protein [Legionella birminghamensis]|nr:hypothetical protein [Legionella birminghamensis]